ncbi:MAG: phosphopyruvate hydratase [Candidatus Rhabdochlamydia sp.]
MSNIESIDALEVLDSRGNPTIEVQVFATDGSQGKAIVPSGASTGEHEAVELRDKDPQRYQGKGVSLAVANVIGPLAELLQGESIFAQNKIDQLMIQADGKENKSRYGANAILGISLAVAKAAACSKKIPLYRYLHSQTHYIMPCPMMNIINGGAHADSLLDFQEFMIRPIGAPSFSEALRWGTEIYHTLKSLLKKDGYSTSVGDEGGFAPRFESNEMALDYILRAIKQAGYEPGSQITIAMDCAASEFYDNSCKSYIERKKQAEGMPFATRSTEELIAYLGELCEKYPIDSIEDPLDQNDWKGWHKLTAALGKKIQIVGDDIFVTNPKFLQRGIDQEAANSILIKLNQIGTLSETLGTMDLAKKNRFNAVISHRSGETEDTTIADLSVAFSTGQIKTGAPCRTDRVAKYNRLLEIEHELKDHAHFGK